MTDDPNRPRKSSRGSSGESAGRRPEEGGGEKPQRAAASEGRERAVGPEFFTDHTPPPISIESGSVNIETDVPFITHDTLGGAAHRHRHQTGFERKVRGLRILNDAGKTLWLIEDTEDTSIKVWYEIPTPSSPEQIFVDGATLTIEADVNLGAGVQIFHPPIKQTVQRIRRHTHPSPNARRIEKVEVITGGVSTIFTADSDRVDKVYIWDTTDTQL